MKTIFVVDAFGFYLHSTQVPDGFFQEGAINIPPPKTELQSGKQWCWNGSAWVQAFAIELQKKLAIAQLTITAYQAEVALSEAGLLTDVMELIEHENTPVRLKLAWKRGVPLQRSNPMVLFIAERKGLTDAQLDDLFLAASKVNPGEF